MELKFISPRKDFALYEGIMPQDLMNVGDEQIDFIFADPPYLLSNGGTTVNSGKRASVDKASWDSSKGSPLENFLFQESWIKECIRVLSKNGVFAISGTMHSIFGCGHAMQINDLKILNDICWFKPNGAPNLGCRNFTNSHETILCGTKQGAKHVFNYEEMKSLIDEDDFVKRSNKQMRDVFSIEEVVLPDAWSISSVPSSERSQGKYPTQKPTKLLNRLIRAFTNEGQLILDPFTGSSTTGIVAHQLNRRFIGIDMNQEVTKDNNRTSLQVSEARYRELFSTEFE